MDKDQLAEYLKAHHLGKENAILSRELEKLFCVNGKELRDIINILRREATLLPATKAAITMQKLKANCEPPSVI